jgi:hypothetical protein
MAEDEIIQKHAKTAYKTWRDPDKNWMHKLKEILVEVLIIVFAVSVSIWLHGWAETRKDHREEKEFYKGLAIDLKADLQEMVSDRDYLKNTLQQTIYLLKAGNGAAANIDSLMTYSSVFFTQVQINPRISRFEALKGSGKLDIIENKKKLINITDLYQKIFPGIFRTNQTFNTLTMDKMAPSISEVAQVDTSGRLVNIKQVLRSSKLQLELMQLRGNAANCITGYTTGIEKVNEIIEEIKEELE